MTETFPRLLGDIGGTNARWAVQAQRGAVIEHVSVAPCGASDSIYESAHRYLENLDGVSPRSAAIGIATALSGDNVRMTNNSWSFSISEFKRVFGLQRCLFMNDFTALAMSLPALSVNDICPVGGGEAVKSAPIALLGPGTGLGVGGLLKGQEGRWSAISVEGGHVTLAVSDDFEAALISRLRERFGHVSAERVLSGEGLINLYRVACELHGTTAHDLTPAGLTDAALNESDAICKETVALFAGFFGNVAGNLALTLGAQGGVYLGGGIVPRLGNAFDANIFRSRFEDKGRFAGYLRNIPSWIITASTLALLGASLALDNMAV